MTIQTDEEIADRARSALTALVVNHTKDTNIAEINRLTNEIRDALSRPAPTVGLSTDLSLTLMQARYVLRNLHAEHPTCGYGKMAEACEQAASLQGEAVAWQHRMRVCQNGTWSRWGEWRDGSRPSQVSDLIEFEERPLYSLPVGGLGSDMPGFTPSAAARQHAPEREALEVGLALALACEAWEADFILNGDWEAENPGLMPAQQDAMLPLQEARNRFKASARKALAGSDLHSSSKATASETKTPTGGAGEHSGSLGGEVEDIEPLLERIRANYHSPLAYAFGCEIIDTLRRLNKQPAATTPQAPDSRGVALEWDGNKLLLNGKQIGAAMQYLKLGGYAWQMAYTESDAVFATLDECKSDLDRTAREWLSIPSPSAARKDG